MQNGSDPEWNVDDYLLSFDDIVWAGGKLIEAPLEFKIKIVGAHVANVLREARQCLGIGAELAAALLGLAVVDYMACFRYGRKSTSSDFQGFIAEYFPRCYQEYTAWIYSHLRCGLMHNLTAINPWLRDSIHYHITGKGDVHLRQIGGSLVFQVHFFLIDTYQAWVMYQHYLIMRADRNSEDVRAFHRRFDRLGGVASMMAKS